MRKILVTGGLGFLGGHIVSELVSRGLSVRVFNRGSPPSSMPRPNSDGVEVIYGDIRDRNAVEAAAGGMEGIIHLVSNFRKGGSDKKEAYAINVEGTEHVLAAALKQDVNRVIHCSTIGVHGSVREIPADENTAFNPGDLYQETKLTAEKRVWEFHRDHGLPITVIRPISMYGPGDLRMLKLFRMIRKRRFVMVGSGEALFQPAYIDDVVRGFMQCLDHDSAVGEAFIIGNEEYVPLHELCRMIAEVLEVPPPRLKVPLAPVLGLASLCERICVPLGIEPPLHRRRISFFQNDRAFSINKARTVIDYAPEVPLKEGIRRTVRWYGENGYL